MADTHAPAWRSHRFSPRCAAAISEAEQAIVRTDNLLSSNRTPRSIIDLLKAVEAVSAVKIDRRDEPVPLLFASTLANPKAGVDASRSPLLIDDSRKEAAREAVNYMRALDWIADTIDGSFAFSPETAGIIHQLCLTGNIGTTVHSGYRSVGAHIGANAAKRGERSPVADPARIPTLMKELCRFMSSSEHSPIGQASIMHFQLLAIWPYQELSDRLGLALSHALFFKRGLVRNRLFVPISWVGAVDSMHRELLSDACRDATKASGAKEHAAIDDWATFNARNTIVATEVIRIFLEAAQRLNAAWRAAVGKVSAQSALDKLMDLFMGRPVLTVTQAAAALEKSFSATNSAMSRLKRMGIVQERSLNDKERFFVAQESAELVEQLGAHLERARASIDARERRAHGT